MSENWPLALALLVPALAGVWLLASWLGRATSPPKVEPEPQPEWTGYPGEGIALLGRTLGPYRLEALLGKGGSGTLYRATDGEVPVAIKVINSELVQDFRRVQREVRNWQDFRHPNVVEFKGFATHQYADGRAHHYLVMELVEGQTLRHKIPADGLPPERVWQWLEPLTEAVMALHALGIIHRDLKPENVMISRVGQLKLLDFGLAKRQLEIDALSLMDNYYGTPSYMDPDQVQVQAAGAGVNRFDPRMDQYSLGVVIYEMLTGRLPLAVHGWRDLIALTPDKHAAGLSPPSRWRKGLSPEVDTVVLRLLAWAPDGRYLTMRDAAKALHSAFATQPGSGPQGTSAHT